MKKGSAHIVTLVQLLILCAMFSTAFMVSRGFFNDLLTAKQYGLEICALFGTVLLALTLLAAALILPPAQSRAAWIAGMVGCLFVLTSHPAFKSTWNNLKKRIRSFTRPIQALSMLATLLVVLVIGFGLYTIKKGSADGRVLIWQVTSQLIKQKPITGHGSGAFAALYMNEQANWFEAGKGTETQSMVAGSPEAPFNEALKLWLEKGLLAVVLAGALLYFLLRDQSFPAASSWQTDQDLEQSFAGPVPYIGVKGSLLALLVFSFFFYPFAISPFVLQLVFLTALLAGASKTILTIKGRKTILLTLPFAMTILVVSIHYYPHRKEHYQAMSVWHEAERWYNFRAYQAAVETYEEALPELNTNGLFLQMYGKALSMNEQHKESNKVLILAQKHFSSQIIQNTLGDNHKAMGNFEAAEKAYRKSSLMIPSSLLPKYLSAILFTESNQLNKARQTADDILKSTIKIESSATREIIREMRKILDTDEN